MRKGRDRLLELHSFNPEVAQRAIERVRAVDADPFWKNFMGELLDHFGVRIKEHEEGDVFYDPSHAYVEAFPSLPAEGMLATYHRRRAIAREDIRFISPDHSLVRDAIDLLLSSKAGTVAFSLLDADTPNLLLEAIFVLEAVADTRWHVEQFLAPMPVRVLVDVRGQDLTETQDAGSLADEVEDGEIQRFLERPEFNAQLLKQLLEGATELAVEKSRTLKDDAQTKANGMLAADLQRLVDLRKLNDHVRPEEIALAQEQLQRIHEAIGQARLRLDSIRLVGQGKRSQETGVRR
jgi:ATP-dependent helicase HepA